MSVSVQNVTREFRVRGISRVALDDVSLEIAAGGSLAVVGESGSGKSTLARLIAGLDKPTSGTVLVEGAAPQPGRGQVSPVQMVFQSPREALNPFRSIAASVAEPLHALGKAERATRVASLLERVGLDPADADRRPESFSGGQQQRAVIARALAAEPRVLVCDEPTSALDVSVQAQIVNLLLELQAEQGFALMLVTHDLGVVRVLAEEVVVLREGSVVEHAPAARFFAGPSHEYARSLLEAAA